MSIKKYVSLEDYLISTSLTVDGQLEDGWGSQFPVKGREIDATILFCDITNFSGRTQNLNPTETLIFENTFFTWFTAEALLKSTGIIDKYIGDEMMVIFSREFGSKEPFIDAVQTARRMCENDCWSFIPHIGIASGRVIVGYAGSQLKYNCSVFGLPVAIAARCASIKYPEQDKYVSSFIVFPDTEWGDRQVDAVLPLRQIKEPDGSPYYYPQSWKILEPKLISMKNLPDMYVRYLINEVNDFPSQSIEERVKECFRFLKNSKRCWPSV